MERSKKDKPSLGSRLSSMARVSILREVLRGVLLVGAPALSQSGCIADLVEAYSVNKQYETLLGVKAFLDEQGDRIKSYAALSDEDMAKRANEISSIISQLIGRLETAKGVADSILETNVRFNPAMFNELRKSLSKAIQKLSPNDEKMQGLRSNAKRLRSSGLARWGAEWMGVDPKAVIRLSGLTVKLRKILVELDASVGRLAASGIQGCSNNPFVDKEIKRKFGQGHCDISRKLFCQAMARVVSPDGEYKEAKLTPLQAKAVQQRLIVHGLLGKDQDDGAFGNDSKKALSKALESVAFQKDILACKK